jgi:hypothetical protein
MSRLGRKCLTNQRFPTIWDMFLPEENHTLNMRCKESKIEKIQSLGSMMIKKEKTHGNILLFKILTMK